MRGEDFEYLLIKSLFHLPKKSILSQSLPLLLHQIQHQPYQLLMTQVPFDLVHPVSNGSWWFLSSSVYVNHKKSNSFKMSQMVLDLIQLMFQSNLSVH